MGFFSKNKDEKSNLPPAPMPPISQGINGMNAVPPSDISLQMPTLNAPPMPVRRNSLEEIKLQVAQAPPVNSVSGSSNMKNEAEASFADLSDESLFDFSNLDIPEPVGNNLVQKQLPSQDESSEFKNTQFKSSNPKEPNTSNPKESNVSSIVDSNLKNESALSFVKNRDRFGKAGVNDSIYVTTSQFKTFLELVEEVRVRVKDSSDKHLRLLDIKSEEDREYEGLRKDFQYIEDKLYEVDSLIFDK